MRNLVTRFARNEDGAAMVEYGLLVALIAVTAGVAIGTVGTNLAAFFTGIATYIASVPVGTL
jgi:pilus assembly protein Flp/PilA